MSKIFDALRKAEEGRDVIWAPPGELQPGVHPRRLRIFETEFGRLSSMLQTCFPKSRTGRVVLVVGCTADEGASYVAANLSRVLARSSGAPVLCLDADFHTPSVPRELKVGVRRGLADVYANGRPTNLTPLIQPADVPNLYAMTTGERRITPVNFFDSEQFETLLQSFRKAFRFVIVDGAPILQHPDSLHLAARTDGVILVVRYKQLKREVVREAKDMLEAVNAPILGAVLNRRKFAIPTLVYKMLSG
jgi:capsular exopolysaccharide synthesis family protein